MSGVTGNGLYKITAYIRECIRAMPTLAPQTKLVMKAMDEAMNTSCKRPDDLSGRPNSEFAE